MSRATATLLFALLITIRLAAQAPPSAPPQRQPPPDMPTIAAALGVDCEYCHGRAEAVTATGKPRLAVAREMIAMTRELNARVGEATGKPAADAVRVDCVTCHRGVAIPRQLSDLMLRTTVQQGPEAAVSLYRDLRTRYFGGQAYDFREDTLVTVADRLAQGRPAAAIAIADLNLEFYPRSVRSLLVKGIALSRRLDTAEQAVATFKQALAIEPDNGVVQGWLIQTEPLTRRNR